MLKHILLYKGATQEKHNDLTQPGS